MQPSAPSSQSVFEDPDPVCSCFYNHGSYSECPGVGHLPPLLGVAVPNHCALGRARQEMCLQGVGAEGASGGLHAFTKLYLSSFGFHYVNRKVGIRVTGALGSGPVRESTESQTRCQSTHMDTPRYRHTKQSPINIRCKAHPRLLLCFITFYIHTPAQNNTCHEDSGACSICKSTHAEVSSRTPQVHPYPQMPHQDSSFAGQTWRSQNSLKTPTSQSGKLRHIKIE